MDKYSCKICKKTFQRNENLKYHMVHSVCKEKTFECRFCKAKFSSKNTMYRHVRDYCKIKRQESEEKHEIFDRLKQLEECNKQLIEKNKKLETDNKKLKKDVKVIKATSDKNITVSSANTPNTINNKYTTNNNINTGTVVNATINLVGYGNEDLSKLSKVDILKALQTGYNSTIKLTEAVHFNPDFPEYHNIYISNMKDKYAMMHDGKKWTLTTKDDLISKIYDDKKSYIEENLEEFIESLHPSRKRALERWLDTDDEDKKIKEIKENIKLLLYNSKNMIIDVKDQVKSKSTKVIKDSPDLSYQTYNGEEEGDEIGVGEDSENSDIFKNSTKSKSVKVIKNPPKPKHIKVCKK